MDDTAGGPRPATDEADGGERVDRTRRQRPTSGRGEWLLVVGLLAAPMAVVPGGDGGTTLVSLWGFATLGGDAGVGAGGYPVWAYFLDQPRPFATLPPSIRAWPAAVAFHVCAAGSATSGLALGREDRRVTGGLLLLAAAATLWVAAGLGVRFGVGATAGWLTVLPVSAVATAAVGVVAYGGDLRAIVTR
jgi:uncharacterized protein (TIGR04206 family)